MQLYHSTPYCTLFFRFSGGTEPIGNRCVHMLQRHHAVRPLGLGKSTWPYTPQPQLRNTQKTERQYHGTAATKALLIFHREQSHYTLRLLPRNLIAFPQAPFMEGMSSHSLKSSYNSSSRSRSSSLFARPTATPTGALPWGVMPVANKDSATVNWFYQRTSRGNAMKAASADTQPAKQRVRRLLL